MTVLPFRMRPVIASRLMALGMASVQLSLAAVTLAQVPRHWTFQSSQRGALLGSAAGPAGDVNGDGLPDIVVGASGLASSQGRVGGILLFAGSPTGLGTNPVSTVFGASKSKRIGEALCGLGDVDGDGLGDLVVGAPRPATRESQAALWLYSGCPTGLNAKWSQQLLFRCPRAVSETRVRAAGDVNGDGFEDVLFSASSIPGDPLRGNVPRAGVTWLLHGSATGLVAGGAPHDESAHSHVGSITASAGDVNGDGYGDVLIGEPMFSTADKENAGQASLYLGSREGLSRQASWVVAGVQSYARFGAALAGVGDLNHDGCADVAIGASGRDRARPLTGQVFVYLGSRHGLSQRPAWTADGESVGSIFGRVIAGAGDVNGDGFADLLVSATEQSGSMGHEGRVYLYLGSAQGLASAPGLVIDGGSPRARYGGVLAAAGDINQDGLADFLIGSPHVANGVPDAGRVDLFYGSREAYRQPLRLVARGNTFTLAATNSNATTSTNSVAPLAVATTTARAPKASHWPWLLSAVVLACAGAGLAWLWRHRAAAVQQERARIARDLHDDLGARLTRLSLKGAAAATNAPDSSQPHPSDGIAEDARKAMTAMREIVWSVDPTNDNLENLATFLGQQAHELFNGTGVRCFTDLPLSLPQRTVSSEVRQNLFLAAREALHNALRHSGAKAVWLRARFDDPQLQIVIEDDGRGLPAAPEATAGNGLRNMRSRLQKIGGTFSIEPRAEGGTRVCLATKL